MSVDEQGRPIIKLGDPAVRYLCSDLYQVITHTGNYEIRRKSDNQVVDTVVLKVRDIEVLESEP